MNKQSEYYFKPKKLFSQNFLIDQNIAKKIASSIHSNEDDYIIEIGCGAGEYLSIMSENEVSTFGIEQGLGSVKKCINNNFFTPAFFAISAACLAVM